MSEKILESTLALWFSPKIVSFTLKTRKYYFGIHSYYPRSSRVKCIFTHSFIFFYFLQVFFSVNPFRVFPKIFSQFLQVSFQVCFQVFFEVFSKYSKLFRSFFLRCGNSVDFLYGGLIVRVSSCLSAFRSFALHTFF